MTPDHLDVLIVGAGLSGISAACHLERDCPGRSYAILEARSSIGGTWDLFRYPGVRSDSDMYTLGFSFRPWREAKAIADGASILEYVRDTAREHGVEDKVRYGRRVVRAEWSSEDAVWSLDVERADSGARERLTCGFLFSCTGYYRYDEGYTPELPGLDRFAGEVVHPQHWTDEVQYAGRRVVVVGSGATAVTLVPALAVRAAHVTMLQRTPSYVLSLPGRDPIADALRDRLPPGVAHPLVRWKNVLITMAFFQLSRRAPALVRRLLRKGALDRLPEGYDVDIHFNPPYDPWDQRLCLVPDGDLFGAVSGGRASIVTDRIDTFTEHGVRLASGGELEADLVVTATGLNLLVLGGIELVVDGRAVDLPRTVAYKGCMLSGVPNLALALGYTNASWTLKCELICRYVCRLLRHMDGHDYRQATPRVPAGVRTQPLLDLNSGYVQRAIHAFPKQGHETPWRAYQNYLLDVRLLRHGPVDDGMEFAGPAPASAAPRKRPSLAA